MAYQIMWTDPAIQDLEDIVRYLSTRNPQAAETFASNLWDKVDLLATQPYMGEVFPSPDLAIRRQILVRPYRVFYRVVEAIHRIEILHVRHSARTEP